MFKFNVLFAQQVNNSIVKGNKAYKKGDFDKAAEAYSEALEKEKNNSIAVFNKANALHKKGKFSEAASMYANAMEHSNNKIATSQAAYNKAVAEIKEKKLGEALASLKQSLKLNPSDTEARENLQKLLHELQQQQKQQQPKDNKQQQNKEEQQPNQQQNKLKKEQIEQLLNQLRNEEKQLQKNLQQQKTKPVRQEKDW